MKKCIKHLLRFIALIIVTFLILLSILLVRESIYINKYGRVDLDESSPKIGEISMYSSPIWSFTLERPNGHSWVYIKNTSEKPFTLNGISIMPNETVSIGTTAHYNITPNGIWFNIEGHNVAYKNNISVTTDFYQKDLDYLETYLEHHNRWTLLYNCTTFVCGIWNNLSSREVLTVHSITPLGLYYKLEKSDIHELDKPFYITNDMFAYKPSN